MLLFASYAEAFGGSRMDIALADDATVADLLEELQAMARARGLPPAAVAVNQEYAAATRRLAPGDEVAIIPPVAGG
ncbi:MAG TPA: MoaD/ThiS family protein [Gemmatimonadaceae bacterium]|nr:MoaD/ThiS family protein [Gemmatimonadaceae bacterium]